MKPITCFECFLPFLISNFVLVVLSVWPVGEFIMWILGGFLFLFALTITWVVSTLELPDAEIPIRRPKRFTAWILGTSCIVIIATQWPLRLAYAISLPAMESAAKSLHSKRTLEFPRRIGCFWIAKVEVSHGVVCLWTNLNPGGRSGFVRWPNVNPPFNVQSVVSLDSTWQFIDED